MAMQGQLIAVLVRVIAHGQVAKHIVFFAPSQVALLTNAVKSGVLLAIGWLARG